LRDKTQEKGKRPSFSRELKTSLGEGGFSEAAFNVGFEKGVSQVGGGLRLVPYEISACQLKVEGIRVQWEEAEGFVYGRGVSSIMGRVTH